MSFLENAKRYLNFIVFFSASIVSIGFSSWQFQIDKGDTSWTPSWSSICNDFPFDMLRPIGVKVTGADEYSYCGYSNGNTGYRLTVAIVMFFFSIVLFFNLLQERPLILNGCYWAQYSLWFLATGLDIVAVANGQAACKDSFTSGATCNNSVYGISIAIDIVICAILMVYIYLMNRSTGSGSAANLTKV